MQMALWQKGEIEHINDDGTFDVRTGSDVQREKSVSQIRAQKPPPSASPTVSVAVQQDMSQIQDDISEIRLLLAHDKG